MFKKFLKIFEKERCCPLCHRGFSDLQDEDKFKNKVSENYLLFFVLFFCFFFTFFRLVYNFSQSIL